MNKRDRQVMDVVYDVVNRISGMYPNNPADIARKSLYLDKIRQSSCNLIFCLSALYAEDYENAMESALEARAILYAQ